MRETFKSHFRREHFAREYSLDLNGTRAAIAVGYSPKTAAQAASRMLRKVKVRVLLKELIGRLDHHDVFQNDTAAAIAGIEIVTGPEIRRCTRR